MIKVVYNQCYGSFNLSERAKSWLSERGLNFQFALDIPRHHPLLVQCVESLKSESNGESSDLKIKEVEKFYIIFEYDGYESVIAPESIEWIDASKI